MVLQILDVNFVWSKFAGFCGFLAHLFLDLLPDWRGFKNLHNEFAGPRNALVPHFVEPGQVRFAWNIRTGRCNNERGVCFKVVEFCIIFQTLLGEVGTANYSMTNAWAGEDIAFGVKEALLISVLAEYTDFELGILLVLNLGILKNSANNVLIIWGEDIDITLDVEVRELLFSGKVAAHLVCA